MAPDPVLGRAVVAFYSGGLRPRTPSRRSRGPRCPPGRRLARALARDNMADRFAGRGSSGRCGSHTRGVCVASAFRRKAVAARHPWLAQHRHFPRRQIPELPRANVLVGDRADAAAPEPDHRMPDRVAHVAHLAVAPFANDERQQRLLRPSPRRSPWSARRPPAPSAGLPARCRATGDRDRADRARRARALRIRARCHGEDASAAPRVRRRSSARAALPSRSRDARPDRRTP